LVLSTASLVALLLASTRAAAWLAVCPPFNTKAIPGIVKGLLSVAIALPVTPGLTAHLPALTPAGLLAAGVEQVVAGAALGFITALLFAAVQAAGDLIDLFGGFSVAFAFDPLSFSGNSVFGRFYNLLATTLLFATSAHELVLRGFAESYHALPLDGALSLEALNRTLTSGLGEMFVSALQIAGPLIGVLFCADVGLGLLSRVAPALNAFSLGFPAKILLTLSLAGLGMATLPDSVAGVVEHAVRAVVGVVHS
jgi:flagellar biosynthesis protein FliR